MEQYCMGCMRKRPYNEKICPVCGWDHSNKGTVPHTLPPGTELHAGKYIVGKVLGQGGFGITYIGFDTTLEMKVAIKEYYPQTFASRVTGSSKLIWYVSDQQKEAGRERFVKEARMMAKIKNVPYVAQVLEVFYQNNTAYIIMGYVEGQTLKRYVEKSGLLKEKECLSLMKPAMKSLSLAHKQGLIHRDISPDNLIVDYNNRIWILDMGAAKEVDIRSASEKESYSTQLVVKKGFSPFEQFSGNGKIGPWTDVYAFAATVYYALTGKVPVDAISRLNKQEIQYPQKISEDMKRVLDKALSLMPEDRYQTMDEFLEAWERPYLKHCKKCGKPLPDNGEYCAYCGTPFSENDSSKGSGSGKAGSSKKSPKDSDTGKAGSSKKSPKDSDTGKAESTNNKVVKKKAGTDNKELKKYKKYFSETKQQKSDEKKKNPKKKTIIMTAAALVIICILGFVYNEFSKPEPTPTNITRENTKTKELTSSETGTLKANGAITDTIEWDLYDNGNLYIGGSGSIPDYHDAKSSPFYKYEKDIINVIMSNDITDIGDKCFYDCKNLVSIKFPLKLERIGKESFSNCWSLTEINLRENLQTIDEKAFYCCDSLGTVNLPENLNSIGDYSFSVCPPLESIVIPDSIKKIPDYAFAGCENLYKATFKGSVPNIKDTAFKNTPLEGNIGQYASANTYLGPHMSVSGMQDINMDFEYKKDEVKYRWEKGFEIGVGKTQKTTITAEGKIPESIYYSILDKGGKQYCSFKWDNNWRSDDNDNSWSNDLNITGVGEGGGLIIIQAFDDKDNFLCEKRVWINVTP